MRAAIVARRNVALAAVAATALAGLVTLAPHPAGAAGTSSTRIANGVTLNHQTYTAAGHPQSVYWVTVAMSAHTGLQVATPRNLMGAKPMTTLAMARQEHAVAGLNGDTFYFDNSPRGRAYTPTLGPRGGVMRNGSLLKAPLDDQNAVFAVTRTGRAYIGPVGYRGTFTVARDRGTPLVKKIASLNSVESAWNGNITMTDYRQLDHAMPSCSQVLLQNTAEPGQFKIVRVSYGIRTYHRIAPDQRALLSCTSSNTQFIKVNMRPGKVISTSVSFRSQGLRTLISGVHQLVRGGKVFTDTAAHKALDEYGSKRMPETFVCVSGNRRTVSLGVFEGHRSGATGVTYAEEAAWLARKGCYEAMAVDGSTSSTLVAQRPHNSLATVNRPTANYPGGMRPQVDGIFVVTH